MGIYFQWDESYSVGNAFIDSQHQQLFEIANSIPDQMEHMEVKSILMRLFKYTREHFAAEEKLMQMIGYPLLPDHNKLHEALISKLNDDIAETLATEKAIIELKVTVYDWLLDHIRVQDQKYAQFARETGVAEYAVLNLS